MAVVACVVAGEAVRPGPFAQQAPLVDLSTRGREAVQGVYTEELAKRARERLEELRREAAALARQERTLLGELRRLEVEREIRATEVARLDAELDDVSRQQQAASARVEALEAQVAAERPEIATRLRRLARLRSPLDAWWLVGVDDLRAASARWRLLAGVVARDRQRVEAYGAMLATLHDERAALEARETTLTALRDDARAARAALDRAAAERAALARRVASQRELTDTLRRELADAESRLDQSLARLADTSREVEAPLPIKAFQGRLGWPLRGRIAGRFGRQTPSAYGTRTYRSGVEIDAPEATPVRAVHEGRVVFAEPFAGFGRLVIVDHGGGAFSLYGHLSSMLVPVGAAVTQGGIVGTVGQTPTGGTALYFELRIDGRPVDPVQWLAPVSP